MTSNPDVYRPARLARRFFARLIDGVIVMIAGSISFVTLYSPNPLSNYLVTGVFTGLLSFVYFVAFEASVGWTPGKKILGLEVRGHDGTSAKPTVGEAAVRNAWTVLPVIPYVGGFLAFVAIVVIGFTIAGSRTAQGKHDEVAHTRVARV